MHQHTKPTNFMFSSLFLTKIYNQQNFTEKWYRKTAAPVDYELVNQGDIINIPSIHIVDQKEIIASIRLEISK